MLEIISYLPFLAGAAKTIEWLNDKRTKTKGDVRAILEEIKNNVRLCYLVKDNNVDPHKVIADFSTKTYDRLNENNFNFNSVKRSKIPAFQGIEKTDLKAWPGKGTADLISNIYDKIKALQGIHKHAPHDLYIKRRLINIFKRIDLLLRHLGKD